MTAKCDTPPSQSPTTITLDLSHLTPYSRLPIRVTVEIILRSHSLISNFKQPSTPDGFSARFYALANRALQPDPCRWGHGTVFCQWWASLQPRCHFPYASGRRKQRRRNLDAPHDQVPVCRWQDTWVRRRAERRKRILREVGYYVVEKRVPCREGRGRAPLSREGGQSYLVDVYPH